MYPWFWIWAPQVHFPWSGSVAQKIEPNTSWFFDAIQPGAGDAEIERKAFDVASYGKQLGLITEVLLGLTRQHAITPEQSAQALERLKAIHGQIEKLKTADADELEQTVARQLERLRVQKPQAYARLAKTIEAAS